LDFGSTLPKTKCVLFLLVDICFAFNAFWSWYFFQFHPSTFYFMWFLYLIWSLFFWLLFFIIFLIFFLVLSLNIVFHLIFLFNLVLILLIAIFLTLFLIYFIFQLSPLLFYSFSFYTKFGPHCFVF
jgi:hypothetical protein